MSQENQNASAVIAPAPSPARGFLTWPQLWVVIVVCAAVGALVAASFGAHLGHFIRAIGIAIVLVAAWYDSATSRIPNKLTYPAILIGLALNLLAAGALHFHWDILARWLGVTAADEPLRESLIGFGACAAIGIVSMLLGGIHGGDMKLISAMGAIFGLQMCCLMLLWALLVAIPLAIINLVADRKLTLFFQFAALQLMNWIWLKKHDEAIDVVSKRRIPIALPLAAGVILALVVPSNILPRILTGGV